jgi:hypothetical protein
VLSLLPAPFSFEMAAPLLALPLTNNERRAIMRRLVNLGLLSYNASLQLFTMHKLVRDAARLLVHNLGEQLCTVLGSWVLGVHQSSMFAE